ncbi:MAG: M20 family metallopeptidase [Ruminococcaceae bacterium]|nr:M20 family metallopeptidase [Oscillospiraceae bacterium]
MKEKLLKAIEERKNELYELVGALIKINSESIGTTGNEAEVARFVKNYLEDIGVESELYSPMSIEGFEKHPDYLDGHNLENRFDVTGVLRGKNSQKSVMLMSHSDTVPIGDESLWSFPPLSGEIRDGKIWGRGACDDKYGIAVGLFLMKLIKELGIKLDCDYYFTAYSDEEYGGGNGSLAACLKYKCDDYVNMDCKNFELWVAGVGGGDVLLEFAADSPKGSCGDAVEALYILKKELDLFGKARKEELLGEELYKNTYIPDTSMILLEAKAGDEGNDLDKGHILIEYFTNKTEEEIDLEFEKMCSDANTKLKEIGFKITKREMTTRFFHFVKSDYQNSYVVKTLAKSAKETSGRTLIPSGAVLSDLSLIVKNGSPNAVAFGVGRAFDVYGGAHQRDENISCDNLLEFAKIMGSFLMNY